MSDIKLFRTSGGTASGIAISAVALERSLQKLIEANLETFFGIRFLATEYSTGKDHGGRMDTLGIDENGCPVIIEYKRATHENVINQGLFYLDWLMDHKKAFEWLVKERVGEAAAQNVEWSAPRLLCIAGDFTKFDEHAIKQMNRNIELIRYRKYVDDLLLFELVNAATAHVPAIIGKGITKKSKSQQQLTVTEALGKASRQLRNRFEALQAFALALGDDVQEKAMKYYVTFKRLRNFACVVVQAKSEKLIVYLRIDPDTVELRNSFARDVRKIGHVGTGDLELTILSDEDLERAKLFIERSYNEP